MSQRQASGEAKEKSIAEKARYSAPGVETEEIEKEDDCPVESASGIAEDAVAEAADETEETTGEGKDSLEELCSQTEICVDFQVDKWDLYVFLMRHFYFSLTGLIGVLLSLFCIGKAISEYAGGEAGSMAAIFLVIGLWFLAINPIMMIGKAALQIKTNPTLQKPITYVFTEKGLIQEQGEVRVGCRWDQVTKTVMTKRIWILYTGKMRGSILPVRQFGERAEELKALIRQQSGKRR